MECQPLPHTQAHAKLLESSKRELQEKIFEDTKATIFRCRAKWYGEGGKKLKIFLQP